MTDEHSSPSSSGGCARRPFGRGAERRAPESLPTGEVQNIADIHADPDYDPARRGLTINRALLGMPLRRGEDIVGAFVLARAEPGAYSERHIEIVQTFADQAVIAIENARLFGEVQASTRDLKEALQQQTATADVLEGHQPLGVRSAGGVQYAGFLRRRARAAP